MNQSTHLRHRRSLDAHAVSQLFLVLLPVDVVQVVDAVLKPALARLAVPPPLLRGRGRRCHHLRLAKFRREVHFPLSGLVGRAGRGGKEGEAREGRKEGRGRKGVGLGTRTTYWLADLWHHVTIPVKADEGVDLGGALRTLYKKCQNTKRAFVHGNFAILFYLWKVQRATLRPRGSAT